MPPRGLLEPADSWALQPDARVAALGAVKLAVVLVQLGTAATVAGDAGGRRHGMLRSRADKVFLGQLDQGPLWDAPRAANLRVRQLASIHQVVDCRAAHTQEVRGFVHA